VEKTAVKAQHDSTIWIDGGRSDIAQNMHGAAYTGDVKVHQNSPTRLETENLDSIVVTLGRLANSLNNVDR
jgi:lipopolysaccharide export system protein LptA